jgi:hypothetical protein
METVGECHETTDQVLCKLDMKITLVLTAVLALAYNENFYENDDVSEYRLDHDADYAGELGYDQEYDQGLEGFEMDYDQDYDQGYDEDYEDYQDYEMDYEDQQYEDQDYERIPSFGASRLSLGRVSPEGYEAVHNAQSMSKGFDLATQPGANLLGQSSAALNNANQALNQAGEMMARRANNMARGRADTFDRLAPAHQRMAHTAINSAAGGMGNANTALASDIARMATGGGIGPTPHHVLAGNGIGRANHLAGVVSNAHTASRLRDAGNRARANVANAPNPAPAANPRNRANAVSNGNANSRPRSNAVSPKRR